MGISWLVGWLMVVCVGANLCDRRSHKNQIARQINKFYIRTANVWCTSRWKYSSTTPTASSPYADNFPWQFIVTSRPSRLSTTSLKRQKIIHMQWWRTRCIRWPWTKYIATRWRSTTWKSTATTDIQFFLRSGRSWYFNASCSKWNLKKYFEKFFLNKFFDLFILFLLLFQGVIALNRAHTHRWCSFSICLWWCGQM